MVFVVQNVNGKNVLGAQRFGEMQVLLPATAQVTLDSQSVVRLMRRKLARFGEADYLLAIGDPAAIGIACAVAAARNNGKFKLLKWDRQERFYYAVSVDLTGS